MIDSKDTLIISKNNSISSPKHIEILSIERKILINHISSAFSKAVFISSKACDKQLYLNIQIVEDNIKGNTDEVFCNLKMLKYFKDANHKETHTERALGRLEDR